MFEGLRFRRDLREERLEQRRALARFDEVSLDRSHLGVDEVERLLADPVVKARLVSAFGSSQDWSIVDGSAWRDAQPPDLEEATLARYGLSRWDYDELRREQSDCCAVCERSAMTIGQALVIDHCHRTGRVRGLLCRQCNAALGLLQDDAMVAAAASSYLMRWEPPATPREIAAVEAVLGGAS